MSTYLLALDPSVRSPGAALFEVNKPANSTRLLTTDRIKIPAKPAPDLYGRPAWTSEAERWLYVGGRVIAWMLAEAQRLQIERQLYISTLVFERPQILRESKSKGDHNQLIGLAAVGTAVAAILRTGSSATQIMSPDPAEWTGQLPKATRGDAWNSPRGRRIADRLTAEERLCVPAQHDAIDAVGLGLWALGRFARRRSWQSAPTG